MYVGDGPGNEVSVSSWLPTFFDLISIHPWNDYNMGGFSQNGTQVPVIVGKFSILFHGLNSKLVYKTDMLQNGTGYPRWQRQIPARGTR